MKKVKAEEWLVALGVATLTGVVLLLQPVEQAELARIDGVAMVTGRILNLPDSIVGQPRPMTENMAAVEANWSTA